MTKHYVSENLRRITYIADLNGAVKHGETFAHGFEEVQSQLEDAYYNARLNIESRFATFQSEDQLEKSRNEYTAEKVRRYKIRLINEWRKKTNK